MKMDERIAELLDAPEGKQYQFKEAKERFDFTEALKCCCALANCGGGKFVLGISDKRPRKAVNSNAFEQPERTRNGLMEKLKIGVEFYLLYHEGNRILVFEIASRPIGLPVQVDGIAWWYSGDSLIPMPQDVLRDIYNEIGHDFSSDICRGASLEDLDVGCIEIFRAAWIEKSGNERIGALSHEQLLKDCGAITDKGITYAALILFGTGHSLRDYLAQSEIVFEYRTSEASGPAFQREEFRAGFFSVYDRIWKLIDLRNGRQHYQEGFHVFDVPTFNERVTREALLNAASHRNYQLSGSIFIRQYNDRLVIESPGGLPFGVTLENILHKQSPRNRRIAEIFALCGLVERSGQGMNLIYEHSVREAKALPSFYGTDDFQVRISLNGIIINQKMLVLIKNILNNNARVLATEDFLVINALYLGQKLPENLFSRIEQLIDIGIVERAGRGKYVLARKLYEAIGETGIYTRRAGLDRETNKALVFRHIRDNGDVGTPFRELYQVLPSHSRKQIQVLLDDLRGERKIYLLGRGRGARWYS